MPWCEADRAQAASGAPLRAALFEAALVMNIGMAREQDNLARQASALTAWQRTLIQEHPSAAWTSCAAWGWTTRMCWTSCAGTTPQRARGLACETCFARRVIWPTVLWPGGATAHARLSALSSLKAVEIHGGTAEADGLAQAMAQATSFYPPAICAAGQRRPLCRCSVASAPTRPGSSAC